MILSPTIKCNLNCRYCSVNTRSESIGELSFEFWKNWILDAEKHIDRDIDSHLSINGGEPFMYRDIGRLVEFLSHRFTLDIVTNLTMFHNCSGWNFENIDLIVSIEPGEHLHDFNRGKGMFQKTIRTLKNISFLPFRSFSIHSIITRQTTVEDLVGFAKFLREILPKFSMTAWNLHKCPNPVNTEEPRTWKVYPDEDSVFDEAFLLFLRQASWEIPELQPFWKGAWGCEAAHTADFAMIGDRYTPCLCYIGGPNFPMKPYQEIVDHMNRIYETLPCWVCENYKAEKCCGCYNAVSPCQKPFCMI